MYLYGGFKTECSYYPCSSNTNFNYKVEDKTNCTYNAKMEIISWPNHSRSRPVSLRSKTRVSLRDIREGWSQIDEGVRGETADSDRIMWFIPKLTDVFDIIGWNKGLNGYADSYTGVLTIIDRDNFCIPLFIPCGFRLITVLPTALALLILRNLVQCKLLISAGKISEINFINWPTSLGA